MEPHLLDRVGGVPVGHAPGRQIMTTRTARTLDRMLREVVSPDGTGSLAQIEGYQVAGKTGTANESIPRPASTAARCSPPRSSATSPRTAHSS